MSTVGAILTLFFCLAVVVLPRHFALASFAAAILYITQGQTIDLGLNFMAIRFVEVAAVIRVAVSREVPDGALTSMERWLGFFFVSLCLVEALRAGNLSLYTLGAAVDACLVVYAVRGFLRGPDDCRRFLRSMAFLLIPISLFMIAESLTGRNVFSVMGGVPEVSLFREGHFRAQASFRSAITAGTVGTVFFPLFAGAAFDRSSRSWAVLGAALCVVIVLASHSSGPLLASVAGVVGCFCWRIRTRMRLVRWLIVGLLVLLQLMMNAPIWYIFDRLSGILGGGGWHRSNLIDQFVRHFGEWWLIGMNFIDTADWAATQIPTGGTDVTNYFVAVGIGGGLVSLLIFVTMLTKCFSNIGKALEVLRLQGKEAWTTEALLWGAGVTILAHVVNLISVTYFDQSYAIWFMHLAIASSLSKYALDLPLPEKKEFEIELRQAPRLA